MSKTISDKSYWRMVRCCLASDMRIGGLAGQAFTNFICVVCEEPEVNGNTSTPLICRKCTNELRPKIKEMFDQGYFSLTDNEIDEAYECLRIKKMKGQ